MFPAVLSRFFLARALAAWKRYELIRDASRDPSELLAETVDVSQFTSQLASSRQR